MGLYVKVSKSLGLAGIKTSRDFRNVQKVIGVQHRSSADNGSVVVREAEGQEVREGGRSCNQLCERASKIKYKKETDPPKRNSFTGSWCPRECSHEWHAMPNHFSYQQFHRQLAALSPIFLLKFPLSLCGCSVIRQNCNISNEWKHFKQQKDKPQNRGKCTSKRILIIQRPMQISKNPNIPLVKWAKKKTNRKKCKWAVYIKSNRYK